jgi:aminoglycoside 6'-N-acetyltransferase
MYQFREMSPQDIPLLFKWANEPHVKPWWKTESDPKKFEERYTATLKSGKVKAYIVSFNDEAIGYLHYWQTESDPQFVHLYPSGAIRMGQLIGEPSALKQSHGTKMIKEFADNILRDEKVKMIVATVDAGNTGAIKAYSKAGFRRDADMQTTNGPVALMERKRTWKLSTKIQSS